MSQSHQNWYECKQLNWGHHHEDFNKSSWNNVQSSIKVFVTPICIQPEWSHVWIYYAVARLKWFISQSQKSKEVILNARNITHTRMHTQTYTHSHTHTHTQTHMHLQTLLTNICMHTCILLLFTSGLKQCEQNLFGLQIEIKNASSRCWMNCPPALPHWHSLNKYIQCIG